DHRNVAAEYAEGGAILRRGCIQVVGCSQAAGAHHVLHHDRRMARKESSDMTRNEPCRKIVTAAGSVADDEIDLAAAVEGLDSNFGLSEDDRRGRKHDR